MSTVSEAELSNARVPGLPPTFYYIPRFVSLEEEEQILKAIYQLPNGRWKNLTHRRLLSLPSTLSGKAGDTLIDSPIPEFLQKHVMARFDSLGIFANSPHKAPNHVLVNEYKPGEGIMPHEDGPAYYPLTATVSLGSHTVLDVYKKNENGEKEVNSTWRILQEPGSLLITSGDVYGQTLHGISSIQTDENLSEATIANWCQLEDSSPYATGSAERKLRISLTYRDVIKVAKLGGALKFMNKK